MNPHYPAVAQRARRRCEYCRAPESVFNFRFDIDHILPQALDGDDALENLALACRACNIFKGAFMQGTDPETAQAVALFHPRRDRWEEHFHFSPETREILGHTATGRATVVRLDLNDDFQREARTRWMEMGLFP